MAYDSKSTRKEDTTVVSDVEDSKGSEVQVVSEKDEITKRRDKDALRVSFPTYAKMFRDAFGLAANYYMDTVLCTIDKYPHLDIIKFDEWLHTKYPDYDDKGTESMSMKEVLEKHYGTTVMRMIENNL